MSTNRSSEETSIYIIDRDYRLVHFNHALKRRFKDVHCGDVCYEKLCGEDRPCQGCPLNQDSDGAVMFYNKAIQQWVEVSSGNMDWPGLGPCRVILVREINEGNKNLFYNLTSISAYDELFELNFTRDSYKILYHQEGKYVIPAPEGTLSSMVQEVSEHMIHPEDARRFLEFWEPGRIASCLWDQHGSHILKGEFRKRKVDGTWCWVVQIVVPILSGAKDEDIVMCFIQDIDEQKRREESLALGNKETEKGTDPITGLCRRPVFFRQSDAFLKHVNNPEDYCLMAIDIEHFKLFNDWYGQEAGDRLLAMIGELLNKTQSEEGGLAGYMGGDDFVILLPDTPAVLRKLQEEITRYMKEQGGTAGFLPAFGIYGIDGGGLAVSNMYDMAVIALSSVKGNYAQRVSRYDSRMKQKLEEDHRLLSEIQRALEHGEITFYAQPKCNMRTGKIVGLESLVRWNHPERGLIAPGVFIPLLENNGLVTKLDLYVWEEVCKNVRKWIDSGRKPVPISVNVSRMDIYTLNVTHVFQELISRYSLDPRLIEIEITESAYVEEYKVITAVVEELRSAGFTVLMDDFGSGYSSLNMLKDVNVDVLKIDMKFLDMDHESVDKGLGILEAITRMANIVGIRMIAEGVESKEQMELLQDMGCTYGQGYYFYHPMPIEVFEQILSDEANIDFRGIKARQIERIRLQELMSGDMVSDAMMNNILGAVAFYDLYDGRLELLRVNEQYCSVTRTTGMDLEEVRKTILDTIFEDDRDQVMEIFSRARQNPIKGAEGDLRSRRAHGTSMWMHLRVFFLREQDGHWLYYGAISDISQQKQREQQLEASQRALSSAVHISEKDESFMTLTEENRRAAAAIFAQMTPGGMIGGYCEEGFPLYFANHEMVKLLGYETFEELSEAIRGKVVNTIHPDDRQRVAADIGPRYYTGLEYTTTYRMPKKDGTWFWTLDKGRVIEAEDGRLAIISACTDISESMEAQRLLRERNSALVRENAELNILNNDMPGGYHRCARTKDFDFTYISRRFLEISGYSRQQIKDLFDNKFINMIHPQDRGRVTGEVDCLTGRDSCGIMVYRMQSPRGYIWIVDQTNYLIYENREYLQGVVTELSELQKIVDSIQPIKLQ